MKSAVAEARQVLVPNGVLILAGMTLPYWGGVFAPSAAYLVALAICAMGVLLAWRFHSPRPLLVLLLLAVVDTIFLLTPNEAAGAMSSTRGVVGLVSFLLPLNYAVLFLVDAPSFDLEAWWWWVGLIVFQMLMATAAYRFEPNAVRNWLAVPVFSRAAWPMAIPQLSLLAGAAVGLGLLLKLLIHRTAVDSGLFWSLCACCLALNARQARFTAAYFALAGLVLGVAVIETSYQVAYHDELTGLPGRRAFNRALEAIDGEYSIAMVDIDHFKRFNDTFGHDIGDQVLRMVASRLARVGGNGAAFRCGGEEFAIVFHAPADEASGHLEVLRETIEKTPFVVRGPDRSRRRRKERRSRHAKRSLRAASLNTSVTVSIGVAGSNGGSVAPEEVVKAADTALYRAKESGRNRVVAYRETSALTVSRQARRRNRANR